MSDGGRHARSQLSTFHRAALDDGVSGMSYGVKFGNNADIDTTSTPEDVWGGGGVYTGMPVSDSETIDIYSSDAADTSAGTGARTVWIQGLDATGLVQAETISLNGVTAVASTGTYTRVNRVKVITAGSGEANAGTLTVEHTTTSANVFATVPIGSNQSRVCAYTVPLGCTMMITSVHVSIARASGAAGSATISLRCRPDGEVFQSAITAEITTGVPFSGTFQGGMPMPALGDVKWHVESVSDNNTVISALFEYLLIDD